MSCRLGNKRAPQNIGYSSRLPYDKCAYRDKLSESVSPLLYRVNPNYMKNCSNCLSVFGPRAGHNGYGVSTTVGDTTAPAQDLVDVESILSNRNVLQSKCKDGKVNEIDVTQFTLQHARTCNDFLDPLASRLTNPPANYRGMNINRFYDVHINPQQNVFYPWLTNSKLEAKDNYKVRVPRLIDQYNGYPNGPWEKQRQPYYTKGQYCPPDKTC